MSQQPAIDAIEEEPFEVEEAKIAAGKTKAFGIAEKLSKLSSKAKLAICVVLVAVIALVVCQVGFSASSPYVGKWYTAYSSDPVIEIKKDGTAVLTDSPEVSISWQELEGGNIKLSALDLSSGKAERYSLELTYGKTNNGIAYLDDGNDLLFESYDDANKIMQSLEEESVGIRDVSGSNDDDSYDSNSSSSRKKYSYSSYKIG